MRPWWEGAGDPRAGAPHGGTAPAGDPRVGDVVLAAAVAALTVAQLVAPVAGAAYQPADAIGVVLLVVLCAPLAVRSVRARAALTAMVVVAAAYALLGYPQVGLGVPLLIAVYTVGARHGLRASAGVLALVALLLVVAFATDRQHPGAVDLIVTAGQALRARPRPARCGRVHLGAHGSAYGLTARTAPRADAPGRPRERRFLP